MVKRLKASVPDQRHYESKGSQLYSDRGELWRYDLESGNYQIAGHDPEVGYRTFFPGKSPTECLDSVLTLYGDHE
jgi:hypothetical protein